MFLWPSQPQSATAPGICDLLAGTRTQQQPGALPTQPRQQLLVGVWGLQLLCLEQTSEPQSIQLGAEASVLLLLVCREQQEPGRVLHAVGW